MIVIYVTSVAKGAGKTMISAGLSRQLQKDGKKVGFLKLTLPSEKQPATDSNSDAIFMKNLLKLTESIEYLCPPFSKESEPGQGIGPALAQVAQNKDVVLIEGLPYAESDRIMAALNARVLFIDEYPGKLSPEIGKKTGNSLLGVVINKVPVSRMAKASGEFSASLGKAGINLLGVIPEDRTLAAMTVAEVANGLGGTILNAQDRTSELVESFMIGAMTVDSGPAYFGRKNNKAVLVRGERPDMQIAALQTSTRCLVIEGGFEPIPAVRLQAESKQVPLIKVNSDTSATIAALEASLTTARFNQEKKLARLDEIMGKHFNYQALYKAIGLAK